MSSGRGDIVVDEQPSRALLSKPAQGSLRSLLHISFFCRRRTQGDGKARKSAQKPDACLGGAPTHARIEASEAVGILDGQRRLAHTTHALNGGAPDRLRHGSGLVLDEDGVEPLEFVRTTCEDWDARGHAEERLTW